MNKVALLSAAGAVAFGASPAFAGITISAGQMLSVPMIVLGIVLLLIAYRKAPSAAGPKVASGSDR